MTYRECLNQWEEETCPCSNHPQGHYARIQHSELLCSKSNSGSTASSCGLSTDQVTRVTLAVSQVLLHSGSSQHPREVFSQFLHEAVEA